MGMMLPLSIRRMYYSTVLGFLSLQSIVSIGIHTVGYTMHDNCSLGLLLQFIGICALLYVMLFVVIMWCVMCMSVFLGRVKMLLLR